MALPAETPVEIRSASEADVPLILRFIQELAEYEQLADQVVATEAGVRETLFGAAPKAEVVFAMVDGAEAGFALFFGAKPVEGWTVHRLTGSALTDLAHARDDGRRVSEDGG